MNIKTAFSTLAKSLAVKYSQNTCFSGNYRLRFYYHHFAETTKNKHDVLLM